MNDSVGGNSATGSAESATPTFADAFASESSPVSGPSDQTNDATAAAQPATDGVTPATDDRSPFIPRARFDEVNGKLNELKQWKDQYGWVEDAQKRAAFDQAVQIGQLYATDRAGYIRQLLADAISDPALAQVIRSEAGRYLAGGRGQMQAPPAAPPPDLNPIPVQLEDGRTVPLYTAEQVQALARQEVSKLREELSPVVKTAEGLQKEREEAAARKQSDAFATTFFSSLQKLPDFDTLRPEIAKRLSAVALETGHPAEVQAATYRIYLELANERKAGDIAKATSDQLDDLRRKASASTSPNPGSAAPTTPKSPKSFYDRDLQW